MIAVPTYYAFLYGKDIPFFFFIFLYLSSPYGTAQRWAHHGGGREGRSSNIMVTSIACTVREEVRRTKNCPFCSDIIFEWPLTPITKEKSPPYQTQERKHVIG